MQEDLGGVEGEMTNEVNVKNPNITLIIFLILSNFILNKYKLPYKQYVNNILILSFDC